MTVRIATPADAPWLLDYLARMGQYVSDMALAERLADPLRLTLIHESGGKADMFLFFRRGDVDSYVGPVGGPAMTTGKWRRPFMETIKALTVEGERRWPGSGAENRVQVWRMWESPMRDAFVAAFGIGGHGEPDGSYSFAVRRNTLLVKAEGLRRI